jgi:hypothetical protein
LRAFDAVLTETPERAATSLIVTLLAGILQDRSGSGR